MASLRGATATKQSRLLPRKYSGLLRGACHRARVRATRWLTMTFPTDTTPRSRGGRRPRFGFIPYSVSLANDEGAGKAGSRLAPAVSCANSARDAAHEHTGTAGDIPAFPAQWVDGLCCALPGDEFLFVTVAPQINDEGWTRLGSFASAELDCSNGSQDHTILPYAGFALLQEPSS